MHKKYLKNDDVSEEYNKGLKKWIKLFRAFIWDEVNTGAVLKLTQP